MAKGRKKLGDAELDMTPMIDVVFQLMIFFLVTMKMEETINEEIELDDSPHAPMIKDQHPTTLILEVDRRGRVSIRNATIELSTLQVMLKNRYSKFGEFPILIRGDKRTKHADIRKVMDVCTAAGLWKINFAAIKETADSMNKRGGGR